MTRLDHVLAAWIEAATGHAPGLILTGGIAALIYAYLVRFLRCHCRRWTPVCRRSRRRWMMPHGRWAAGPGATLALVHAPMLWRSALSAGPSGVCRCDEGIAGDVRHAAVHFDTLAVQAYNLASDERLAEASTAALTIVVVGLLPLIVLSRMILRPDHGSHRDLMSSGNIYL